MMEHEENLRALAAEGLPDAEGNMMKGPPFAVVGTQTDAPKVQG